MNEKTWAEMDAYLESKMHTADAVLEAARADSTGAGLPEISVTPSQGKLLHLLARMRGAKRILEIGTLGGYSTIWLARALPADGRLVTLELDPKHAKVAQANVTRAKLADKVEIRLGPAAESLKRLGAEKAAAFDLIFIDADKANIPVYFEQSLKLSHPGTAMVVDNVIRKGAILDAASADDGVQGVRRFNDLVAAEPRVSATTLQTVGAKGYDGFALLLVNRV